MTVDNATPIPFSFFVSLCRELSKVEPRSTFSSTQSARDTEPKSIAVFRRWVRELRRRFSRPPPETTTNLFLFLFPEEDTRRKYGMQEPTLARALVNILGVSDEEGSRGANLRKWADTSTGTSSLGEEVYNVMSHSSLDNDDPGLLCIEDMSSMLDDLASKSTFSALGLRQPTIDPSRTRQSILQTVYCELRPFEAAVLTQIILKDLRPILYPVKNTSTTISLLNFNSKAVHMLTLQEAMRIWDPSCALSRCYDVRSTIEHSIRLFQARQSSLAGPEIGVPIQISKCVKGQGCANALANFKLSTSIWAETKYDGERMQIHVAANKEGHSEITIFSKSKRDSTSDRIATHWIIREALGLHYNHPEEVRARASPRTICNKNVSSVILEAEMVAYDEHIGIDGMYLYQFHTILQAAYNVTEEYWRIRDLVESTACGARSEKKNNQNLRKIRSSGSPSETSRHLAIVFFDILYLNGSSLISESYCTRRATLEAVVNPIPMYASLACRVEIVLFGSENPSQGLEDLQQIFSSCIANFEEGLVLKASNARYADWRNPWVKLKKDYIPGYGDTMDLVIVAATWDKERGRILRVPTTTYTTFYIGVFCSKTGLANGRPHLEVYFTVSYGLDRNQLEELNLLVKTMDPVGYKASMQRSRLPFTFNLAQGLAKPATILTTPLLVELFGAGFSKSGETKHYELRFPRMNKVYRTNDRSWLEGVNVLEFNDIAHKAVGKGGSAPEKRSVCAILPQRLQPSATASSGKRKSTEVLWMQKLKEFDAGVPAEVYEQHLGLPSRRHQKRRRIDENNLSPSAASNSVYAKLSHLSARVKPSEDAAKGPLTSLTNHETEFVNPNFYGETDVPLNDTCYTRIDEDTRNGHRLLKMKAPYIPVGPNQHPFATFLGRAIILSDCCFYSREYDRTFIGRFVMPNLVHSCEAFALGCGWSRLAAAQLTCETMSYGIVFVGEQSSRDWRDTPPFTPCSNALEADRKPIFIFSTDCLRADILDGGWVDSEMDIKAKCLAVYL